MFGNQRVNEINDEIARLQEERTNLINEENKFDEEKIKSLDWTKDFHAFFRIDPLGGAAGLFKYIILIVSQNNSPPAPLSLGYVRVLGDSSLYEQNLNYGRRFSDEHHGFLTNSKILLKEFLNKTTFKSLKYDNEELDILLAAKEASERYLNKFKNF